MSQRKPRLPSRIFGLLLSIPLIGAACSDNATPNPDPIPDPVVMTPLPPGTKVMHLISSDYTINPGKEGYQCQRITVDRDLYIMKITPVAPLGVHHEVLAIDPKNGPDGVTSCGPLEQTWQPLFASGVGSPALDMPEGVALKIPKGAKLVLDLHLFNARTADIVGNAAIDVVAAEEDHGYQIATVPFIGPVQFTIGSPPPPAGTQPTVSGKCTVTNDTTFFAVFPHMHTTGRHIKISAGKTGTEDVVWDEDYNFNEQSFGVAPTWRAGKKLELKKNDKIAVTCTYDTSAIGKKSGDSTTDEMCFAISYVTPAIKTAGTTPFCFY